jgi:hypothetical protein
MAKEKGRLVKVHSKVGEGWSPGFSEVVGRQV